LKGHKSQLKQELLLLKFLAKQSWTRKNEGEACFFSPHPGQEKNEGEAFVCLAKTLDKNKKEVKHVLFLMSHLVTKKILDKT